MRGCRGLAELFLNGLSKFKTDRKLTRDISDSEEQQTAKMTSGFTRWEDEESSAVR